MLKIIKIVIGVLAFILTIGAFVILANKIGVDLVGILNKGISDFSRIVSGIFK